MRNSITLALCVVGLGLALTQPSSAAQAPGGVQFLMADGSVHHGLLQGTTTLVLEENAGTLRASLRQRGRTVVSGVQVSFRPAGCGEGWPAGWQGARATVRPVRGEADRLEMRPRDPQRSGCLLIGKLPSAASTGAATGLTGLEPGPPGGGKDPAAGGPDQGFLGLPKPDLQIRQARPSATDGSLLEVVLINAGPGTSDATEVTLYFQFQTGQAVTGSAPIPPLAAGQMHRVVLGVGSPLAAAAALQLRADEPNQVAESDETNNGFVVHLP